MAKYAANTSVSSELSRNQIERTLIRYGANQFAYATSADKAMIAFTMSGKQVRFILPLPSKDDYKYTPTKKLRVPTSQQEAWEQACRQRWRALDLVVKAKLEAVESGISIFEEEFLANIVLPNGQTVKDVVLPAVEQAYLDRCVSPIMFLLEG